MTQYHSKPVSQEGCVEWSLEDDAIWHDLVKRQLNVIKDRACDAYLHGLSLLNLPIDRVPQLPEINKVLKENRGQNRSEGIYFHYGCDISNGASYHHNRYCC